MRACGIEDDVHRLPICEMFEEGSQPASRSLKRRNDVCIKRRGKREKERYRGENVISDGLSMRGILLSVRQEPLDGLLMLDDDLTKINKQICITIRDLSVPFPPENTLVLPLLRVILLARELLSAREVLFLQCAFNIRRRRYHLNLSLPLHLANYTLPVLLRHLHLHLLRHRSHPLHTKPLIPRCTLIRPIHSPFLE